MVISDNFWRCWVLTISTQYWSKSLQVSKYAQFVDILDIYEWRQFGSKFSYAQIWGASANGTKSQKIFCFKTVQCYYTYLTNQPTRSIKKEAMKGFCTFLSLKKGFSYLIFPPNWTDKLKFGMHCRLGTHVSPRRAFSAVSTFQPHYVHSQP